MSTTQQRPESVPANGPTYHVGYAYPTSPAAKAMRRESTGGYYVQVHGLIPCDTFEQAMALAAELQATPDRWSMDHPLNLKFLTPEQRNAAFNAAKHKGA